jgi:hypothetical protein
MTEHRVMRLGAHHRQVGSRGDDHPQQVRNRGYLWALGGGTAEVRYELHTVLPDVKRVKEIARAPEGPVE